MKIISTESSCFPPQKTRHPGTHFREFPEDCLVPLAYAFPNDAVVAPDIFRILLDAAPETARELAQTTTKVISYCTNAWIALDHILFLVAAR